MAEQVYGVGLNTQPQQEYDFIGTALQIGEFQERKKQRVRQERQSELGDGSAIYNRAGASIRHQPLVDLAYQGWVEAGTMYQKTGDPEYKMQAQNYLNQLKDIQANAKVINDYSYRNAVDARRNPHLYGTTSAEVEQGFNNFHTPLEGYVENGVVMVKDEDGQARPYNEAQAFKRDYSVPKSLDKVYGSKETANKLWRAGYQNSKEVKSEDASGNITYNPEALRTKARDGAMIMWEDNPVGFQEFAVVNMLKEDNPDFNLNNPEDVEAYSLAMADPSRRAEAKQMWLKKVEDDVVARTPATNLRQASSGGGSTPMSEKYDFQFMDIKTGTERSVNNKDFAGSKLSPFVAKKDEYVIRGLLFDNDGNVTGVSVLDNNSLMKAIEEELRPKFVNNIDGLKDAVDKERASIDSGSPTQLVLETLAKRAKAHKIDDGDIGETVYGILSNDKTLGPYIKGLKETAKTKIPDKISKARALLEE